MPSYQARFLLFLSSYSPLFFIFFFIWLKTNIDFAVICFILGLIGPLGAYAFLKYVGNKTEPEVLKIIQVRPRDEEAISYIVSYVIPFLSTSASDWGQQVGLLIFFLVIAILYINSNLIHINPILNLLGYRTYEITLENGFSNILITSKKLKNKETITAFKSGDNLFVESEKNENG